MPSHTLPATMSNIVRFAVALSRAVGALCAAVVCVAASPYAARACSPAQPQWEMRPWNPQDEDGEAPTVAPVISGSARAPEATEGCGGDDDLGSDRGDCSTLGSVTIRVEEPPVDDETSTRDIAYRIEILDGTKVFPQDRPIYARARGDDPAVITTLISTAKLRTRLRVIPVDAAGNEGPASNTIVIGFDESGACALLSSRSAGTLLPSACVLVWGVIRGRRRVRKARSL